MDREYIKAIVRMVIVGYDLCAISHILSSFRGIPVVDFVEVFCNVAETEFMIDDRFIPLFKDIKTTDELEWMIIYASSLLTKKKGWS